MDLNQLNPQQLEAVTTTKGPVLVIAGAGSGKTRTLVYRVAYLVENGIPPESILLLTFTRRAAEEMLSRASQLSDKRCGYVTGGTFHSFCYKMLRQYHKVLSLPNGLTVLDRGDTEDIIQSILTEQKEKVKSSLVRLPKKGTIAEIFSKATNLNLSVGQVLKEQFPHFMECHGVLELIRREYESYKTAHGLLDYDDLLVRFLELLETNQTFKEILLNQFTHIMVDEYQDTNKIQAKIIVLLGQRTRNVMVVGDDSQAIYAFRGADYKNMFQFSQHFPEAKVIKLEENYRSTQPILDLTNSIMERARRSYTKCLFTRRPGGRPPRLVDTRTEVEQAIFVCDTIQELQGKGLPLSEIAVLFRATYHSFELEAELTRRRISYVKYGGFKFLEAAHIKDLLSFLRALLNPEEPMALARVLLMAKNIGPTRVKRLQKWLKESGLPLSHLSQWPEAGKRGQTLESLLQLSHLFQKLEGLIASPGEAVEMILQYYLPILKERYDDYPRRQRELQELITMAKRYHDIPSFVADLILDPPNSTLLGEDVKEALTLSTVHSAKGLEWAVVFIIWVSEGRFPSQRAYSNHEELEEERRLFYVASTRAKDDLILCYPSQDARYQWGLEQGFTSSRQDPVSSFLLGIPPHTLRRVEFIKGLSILTGDYSSKKSLGTTPATPKIPTATKKDTNLEAIRPGAKVSHPAFGMGIVSKVLDRDKVEVLFASNGKKILHLGYSKLEVVG